MGEQPMIVWITKYALTAGIKVAEARVSAASPDMIVVRNASGYDELFHGEGRDWHRTQQSALDRAVELRTAKLASLAKQMKKLEKLVFIAPHFSHAPPPQPPPDARAGEELEGWR